VVILEREAIPRRIIRPEILWQPTLAALDRLGLGEPIRSQACVRLNQVDVGGLLVMRPGDFAAAGAEAFSTDPFLTRQLITAAAQATGNVDLLRGVEVTSRVSDGPITRGVAGMRANERLEIDADLVVGADGVHSFLRSSLGIAIDLRVFPIDFLTASLPWPTALAPDGAKVYLHRGAFREGMPAVALIPGPSGKGVVLIPLPSARADRTLAAAPAQFWDALAATVPASGGWRACIEFPRDFVRATRPFGHAAGYVRDGAALIGDAAHPMTPAGGQGANASIWDALADVADGALKSGNVSRERLAPYERRRRPINERSVQISRTAWAAFRFGRCLPLGSVVPLMLRTVDLMVWPKRAFLRRISRTLVDRDGPRP